MQNIKKSYSTFFLSSLYWCFLFVPQISILLPGPFLIFVLDYGVREVICTLKFEDVRFLIILHISNIRNTNLYIFKLINIMLIINISL